MYMYMYIGADRAELVREEKKPSKVEVVEDTNPAVSNQRAKSLSLLFLFFEEDSAISSPR